MSFSHVTLPFVASMSLITQQIKAMRQVAANIGKIVKHNGGIKGECGDFFGRVP